MAAPTASGMSASPRHSSTALVNDANKNLGNTALRAPLSLFPPAGEGIGVLRGGRSHDIMAPVSYREHSS